MLSNASQYAIRSVIFLALFSENSKKISVKEIAEKLETPQPFLAKLMQQLTKNELVSSTKGPNGGFYLSESNKENSVWDVIKCFDGSAKFEQCFMGLSKCGDDNPCPVHYLVAPFKKKMLEEFRDKTIVDFSKGLKSNGKVISLKDFDLLDN
jgi:Rrf2 family transcriptional regulator, iron-sulfur cluster assembly transcription factor